MVMFSDSGGHALTQVLFTHYLIKSGNNSNSSDNYGTVTEGSLDTSAHDHVLHVYSRSYALTSAAGTVGTWSKWKVCGGEDVFQIAQGASAGVDTLGTTVTNLSNSMLQYSVLSTL